MGRADTGRLECISPASGGWRFSRFSTTVGSKVRYDLSSRADVESPECPPSSRSTLGGRRRLTNFTQTSTRTWQGRSVLALAAAYGYGQALSGCSSLQVLRLDLDRALWLAAIAGQNGKQRNCTPLLRAGVGAILVRVHLLAYEGSGRSDALFDPQSCARRVDPRAPAKVCRDAGRAARAAMREGAMTRSRAPEQPKGRITFWPRVLNQSPWGAYSAWSKCSSAECVSFQTICDEH